MNIGERQIEDGERGRERGRMREREIMYNRFREHFEL